MRAVEIEGFGVGRLHPVAQFRERFKEGGTKPHLFLPPFVDGARQPLQAGNPGLMLARPFRERVGIKLVDVLADLGLAKLLLLGVGRLADHFRDEGNGAGDLKLIERKPLRIEVIDGQFAIGMNQDRPAAQTLGELLVGKPFLDDDGVVVTGLGLGQEVVHRERLARAGHADEHRMLRRAANERPHPGKIAVGAVVDRLGLGQMRREGGRERQEVGQIAVLGVKIPVPVTAAGPAGPSRKEEFLGGRREGGFINLRSVHLVHRVLDRGAFGMKAGFGPVPNADEILDVEREGKALGERIDFPLLLFQGDGHGVFAFLLVIAAQAVDGLFLAGDFLANRDGFEIDRDLIVEERQRRQPVDDAGIGLLRPTLDREKGVIMPVEIESGLVLQSHAIAVPAQFLNGKLLAVEAVKIDFEPVGQRRIEEPLIISEVLQVGHRANGRARAQDGRERDRLPRRSRNEAGEASCSNNRASRLCFGRDWRTFRCPGK